MYSFKVIDSNSAEWHKIESTYDSTCFHTMSWCKYVESIGYKVFILEIQCKDVIVGYFVGEKIGLGYYAVMAPQESIGTYTQGLCMLQEISESERVNLYKRIAEYLFSKCNVVLFTVDDWQLKRTYNEWIPNDQFHHEDIEKIGFHYTVRPTLYVPINTSEEEMWANLHYKSCKYSVNKARKLNLKVKEITDFNDIKDFTKIHYKQLTEVCAKQGMKPNPSQREYRMRALCESLFPSRIIMLEVIGNDEDGNEQIMSTGIFCIDKGQCSYWTGASYQRYQKYCPNELMVWEAMRLLHQRGGGELNFCGMASYKLKFGTKYAYIPRIYIAKYPIFINILPTLKKAYYAIRRTIAKIVGKKSFK